MSEIVQKMIAFVLEKEVGLRRERAVRLSNFFGSLDEFLSVERGQLKNQIKTISGKPAVILKDEEINKIIEVVGSGVFDPSKTIEENYLYFICKNFTITQMKMLRNLTLSKISPNPLLVKSLNLSTPEECVKLNLYALVTRSVVTSMGFFVEDLLLSSSGSVEKIKDGWDILKTSANGEKHWIQVKSGPNDMDKDQIVHWAKEIDTTIKNGDKAYIGITYGKRNNNTVTLGLFKKYLEEWEERTLIGRELWDFVSDDPNYHEKLFDTLGECGKRVLSNSSFCEEIDICLERLTEEFIKTYGNGEEGVQKYIDDIF